MTQPATDDPIALGKEFADIRDKTRLIAELKRKAETGTKLTVDEDELVKSENELIRRGMECSMILRRTNTGPAQVKLKGKAATAAKQKLANSEIDALLNSDL